tara:strand:+ start:790 stop:963 length:174 start_codon:yes stop_codon:yes gene_type:complete
MSDYIKTQFLFWLGTGALTIDVVQFSTGVIGIIGACFMAVGGYYHMRIKKGEWDDRK